MNPIGEKIVFFHMNQLGDLLFSLPLIAAVKTCRPGTVTASVVRPSLARLLEATGLVDDILVRPHGDIRGKLELMARLRREKFSCAVLFSESPQVACMSYAAGIPERIGFKTASLRLLLTRTVERSGVPSLDNNRRLAESLGLSGVPADYTGLVKAPDNERSQVERWLTRSRVKPEALVVLCPGSSRRRREKHWDEARWSAFIDRLHAQGLQPVVAGSPGERVQLETIACGAGQAAPVFAGEGGIPALAAVLSFARFFIGIDSGAMHLAAALAVPVVALFGPTDPRQVGPRPLERHHIIQRPSMSEITVDDVMDLVDGRLISPGGRHA